MMRNLILSAYDPDFSSLQQAFLMAQKYQQGINRDQPVVPTGPGIGNDAYGGGSISGHDFNQAMARSWGAQAGPASQPLHNSSNYLTVSVFHPKFRDDHPLTLPFHKAAKYPAR
jgi:hypothetical protein